MGDNSAEGFSQACQPSTNPIIFRIMSKRDRILTAAFVVLMPALFHLAINDTLASMTKADCQSGIVAACQSVR